jgi:hypothetical protein
VADGINPVRTFFPVMWFDKERRADGVQALKHHLILRHAEEAARQQQPRGSADPEIAWTKLKSLTEGAAIDLASVT